MAHSQQNFRVLSWGNILSRTICIRRNTMVMIRWSHLGLRAGASWQAGKEGIPSCRKINLLITWYLPVRQSACLLFWKAVPVIWLSYVTKTRTVWTMLSIFLWCGGKRAAGGQYVRFILKSCVLRAFTLWSSLILPELRPKTALVRWWCSVLFFPTYTHALRETSPTFLRFIGFDGCFHATTKPGQQREGMHRSWWLMVEAVPSTCGEWTLWCLKKAPHLLYDCVCATTSQTKRKR